MDKNGKTEQRKTFKITFDFSLHDVQECFKSQQQIPIMNSKNNKVSVIYNNQNLQNKSSISNHDLTFSYYKLITPDYLEEETGLQGTQSWSKVFLDKDRSLVLHQRFELVFSNLVSFNEDFTERVQINGDIV